MKKMTLINNQKSPGCETEAILPIWGGSPLTSVLRRQSPNIAAEAFVPLTGQFSNSFYENLSEIYDLREVLINEGIMDKDGFILPMTEIQSNSNIPYRN